MESYSYVVELGVLPIIVTIMISLRKDCYTKSVHYKYLSIMYNLAFYSSVVTFITSFFDSPLGSQWAVTAGYAVDTLYFMLVPSTAIMYALYVTISTSEFFSVPTVAWKKILLFLTPYMLYLVFVVTNLHTKLIFSMTQATGYIRGPLYELPYPLVTLYGILIVVFIVKNFNYMPKESSYTILSTAVTALFIVVVLFYDHKIILTGLLNTMCILSVHLHALNNSKREDTLTGTQNRIELLNQLEKDIATKEEFSLYVISIRGMKHINEQYGLHIGDKKLHNIAEILLRHVRRERVYRYSGDEFALLLPFHKDDISPVMKSILEELNRSIEVEKNMLPIEVSTIRVDYPVFGTHVGDLVAVIDYGIHLLKDQVRNAKNYLYDVSTADTMKQYHATINELHSALKEHRFVVHYQPIYHTPSGTFTQAEALIRMEKQDGTLVYPNDFIDVANDTGLIIKMTYQMLEQVCQDFRTLLNEQPNTTLTAISVNVPYIQFVQPDMEEHFMQILDKYQIAPSQIKIEVTERMMVEDFDMMSKKMNHLTEKGFTFELDDFGIGYSNLQMSLDFPMEIVKLDRSIILTALASETGYSFFQHITAGINSTGRKTLAEGVETQEQVDWTKRSNCEYIQGYFFSKPVCFGKFSEFLSE